MKPQHLSMLAAGIASAPLTEAAPTPPPAQRVVLVHGIFQGGELAFGKLRRRLEAQGVECLAPTLFPVDGHKGLEQLAEQLRTRIHERFGPTQRVSIVSFSMGGLVSRYYLQELGGAKRCDRFITLSTPHHGTQMAWFYFGRGAAQMRPGSEFLQSLQRTEKKLGTMPVTSFRTPYDLIILPTTSSVWDRAENQEFPVWIHPWMTRSDQVVQAVEDRLFNRKSGT